jgi:hypothetical protein
VGTGHDFASFEGGLGESLMSNTDSERDDAARAQRAVDPAGRILGAASCPQCGHALTLRLADGWPAWLPDPREEPTVPVWPVVGRLLGRKRSAILELARQNRLPVRVLRVGRSYRVATAELLSVVGFEVVVSMQWDDRNRSDCS